MIYIIITIVLFILGTKIVERKGEYLPVFIIFFVFCFLYTASIPLERQFFDLKTVKGSLALSDIVIKRSLILYATGALGFILGIYISKFGLELNYVRDESSIFQKRGVVSVMFLITIIFISLIGFYFDYIIISFKSYKGNYTYTYNNPIYAFLKETLYFALSVLICLFYLDCKKISIAIGVLLSVFLIFIGLGTSDKDPVFLAGISNILLFWPLYQRIKISKLVSKAIIFLIAIFILPLLSLKFSLQRGNEQMTIKYAVQNYGLFSLFDSRGPFISEQNVLDSDSIEYKYGKTYMTGCVYWIPKFMWVDRPVTLAEDYAKNNIKDWKPGEGFGYSPMTEAYINFGMFGGFIHFLICGLFIGAAYFITKKIFRRSSEIYIVALFYVWLVYNLLMMFRGQFALPSTFIRYMLPFYIFYLFFDQLKMQDMIVRRFRGVKK